MRTEAVALLLLLVLVNCARGYLNITSTKELASNFDYDGEYGILNDCTVTALSVDQVVNGTVLVPADDNLNGCGTIEHGSAWTSPFILLLQRGDCSFAQKILNAAQVGAVGVIIVDNVDEDVLPIVNNYMMDTVIIPAAFVSQEIGLILMDYIVDSIVLEIHGRSLPKVQDGAVVPWSLWTSAVVDSDSVSFMQSIYSTSWFGTFSGATALTPRFMFRDGLLYGCGDGSSNVGNFFCTYHCTNRGRYCAYGTDSLPQGVMGADVVRQNVRQICARQLETSSLVWWQYADCVRSECKTLNQSCVESCEMQFELSSSDIDSCVQKAGGVESTDFSNSLIDQEISDRRALGIVNVPSLVVYNDVFNGSWDCSQLYAQTCGPFGMICSSFFDGLDPCLVQPPGPPEPGVYNEQNSVLGTVIALGSVVSGMLGIVGIFWYHNQASSKAVASLGSPRGSFRLTQRNSHRSLIEGRMQSVVEDESETQQELPEIVARPRRAEHTQTPMHMTDNEQENSQTDIWALLH
eukprot:TRINITY_DN1448_c0_g1_i1.p1 TRINITY_DN1448_c0_g1~~TRINITY_DN1448_c0_g1_i1.p1  ORF type:complete len:520 (-),score=92.65 TRINITY_DN1448_c0_g1_i1:950-2509(-)